MNTIDIIIYVVAIVVLVIASWIGTITERLFAVALICIVLVPLIALIKAS